jgi:16S rRNA (guanine(966)-N(2))-methyltransferase RsmD
VIRIISGTYRSRQLKIPSPSTTRPTKDRVREGIFSSINASIKDAYVVDVFAGSGAMGFEAISRGAAFCLFNDVEEKPYKVLKQNVALLKVEAVTEITKLDAFSFLKALQNKPKTNIIFLDPPYQYRSLNQVVKTIEEMSLLANNGIIVIESDHPFAFDITIYQKIKVYTYGKSIVTVGWKA